MTQPLNNQEWFLDQNIENSKIKNLKTTIPTCVHLDLLKYKIIEDPYVKQNELQQRWIGKSNWTYSCNFQVEKSKLKDLHQTLIFEGIDTISDVYLNEKLIGKTDNMFKAYEFNVKYILKESNKLRIELKSPIEYALDKSKESDYEIPCPNYVYGEKHRNFIRKCGSDFAWDWGPCISSIGIYKSVHLLTTSFPLLKTIKIEQNIDWNDENEAKNVKLIFKVSVYSPIEIESNLKLQFPSTENTKQVTLKKGIQWVEIEEYIQNPKLWFPLGYGEQYLYFPKLMLETNEFSSEKSTILGIRQVELDTSKDEYGSRFRFIINKINVICKGANWIPYDSYHILDKGKINNLLSSAKDANMNMLRIWGGGIYEDDHFYQKCNELGIMIWQDFCFACSLYPSNENFLQNVQQEIVYQVDRLYNNPSIVVYAGNNENEEAFSSWEEINDQNKPRLLIDYHKLFYDTIYETFKKQDDSRPFWPSSPSNGLYKWGNAGDITQGDVHYWGVWHGNKPFSEYLKIIPRFCSEFGFQSMPSFEVISSYLDPEEDFNLTSPGFEFRQRSPLVGNRAILEHITREFRIPIGFESMIFVSQLSQALAIKTASEHWRRIKECDGILFWQLNDIWPGMSWSSINYGGKWKILQYFVRDFFSPVLVSPFISKNRIQIFVINDTLSEIKDELIVEIHSLADNRIIEVIKIDLKINPQSKNSYWDMDLNAVLSKWKLNETNCFLTAKFQNSFNFLFFCELKKLKLQKPKYEMNDLKSENNKISFKLSSNLYTPFVYLQTKGIVNENGFHLFGDSKEIQIEGITSTNEIQILSLRDTY
eukprot:gene7305-11624_t